MSYSGITISFACRLCTTSFEQIDDFIAHKKENHFQEFQETTSIVFEDKPSPPYSFTDGCVPQDLLSSVLVKLENFFDDVGLTFEPILENQSEAAGLISSTQPICEIIPNKIETIKNKTTCKPEIEIQPQYKNPFVLLKRLSREEINRVQKTENVVKNKRATTPVLDSVQKTSHKKSNIITVNLEKNPAKSIETEDRGQIKSDGDDGVNSHHAAVCKPDCPPTSNKNLKRNIRSSPSKRLNCSFSNCKKSFSTKCLLERHLMRHNNEKPFKCSFTNCKHGFNSKYDLNQHFRRHSGAKPYKCPEEGCGKAFANSGTFSNHKMTHSQSASFKCTYPSCKRAFKLKRCFRRHLLRVHAHKVFGGGRILSTG